MAEHDRLIDSDKQRGDAEFGLLWRLGFLPTYVLAQVPLRAGCSHRGRQS